jgi:FRG domain
MTALVAVKSPKDAIRTCWDLAATAPHVFRGQAQDWPLVPTLFRLPESERWQAFIELDSFGHWAATTTDLPKDPLAIKAIAQHYHMPTELLDLTTSPDAACFFAQDTHDANADLAVIYAFAEEDLRDICDLSVVSLAIDGLWRMERQSGRFLRCSSNEASILASIAKKIFFPRQSLQRTQRAIYYPEHKSRLETSLDSYFSGVRVNGAIREHERLFEAKVLLPQAACYGGLFRNRNPHIPGSGMESPVSRPLPRPVVTSRTQARPVLISRTAGRSFQDDLEHITATATAALHSSIANSTLVDFEVDGQSFGKVAKSATLISQALKWTWDGYLNSAFAKPDVIEGFCRTLRLLITRAYAIDGIDRHYQNLYQVPIWIELASLGGSACFGRISKDDLLQSIRSIPSPDGPKWSMLAERLLRNRDERIFGLCSDPAIVLDSGKLECLFATQVIPGVVDYWLDQNLVADDDTYLPWQIHFATTALEYIRPSSYSLHSPVAGDSMTGRTVLILNDMSGDEILDAFLDCQATVDTVQGYFVKFDGYSLDTRELFEIPEAVAVAKSIVEFGGLSVMVPFPEPAVSSKFLGFSAFQLWCISKIDIGQRNGILMGPGTPLFAEFMTVLEISNRKFAHLYKHRHVFRGPD